MIVLRCLLSDSMCSIVMMFNKLFIYSTRNE